MAESPRATQPQTGGTSSTTQVRCGISNLRPNAALRLVGLATTSTRRPAINPSARTRTRVSQGLARVCHIRLCAATTQRAHVTSGTGRAGRGNALMLTDTWDGMRCPSARRHALRPSAYMYHRVGRGLNMFNRSYQAMSRADGYKTPSWCSHKCITQRTFLIFLVAPPAA